MKIKIGNVEKELELMNNLFIKNFILSVIGVLATGIIFVVALHIAHG